jgi:hypothetical protein
VITTRSNRRGALARRGCIMLALLGAMAAAAAGCGDDEKERRARGQIGYEMPPAFDRSLTGSELDSLRTMKVTHNITRDEYWEKRGGVVANDRLEVWYTERKARVLEAMGVLKLMDEARTKTRETFGRVPPEKLVVLCAPSLEVFRRSTGRDWWHYALIKGDTISFQTPLTLHTRGLLRFAAPHEYHEWALGRLTAGKAPRWVVEGVSAYLAGENPVFVDQRKEYVNRPLRMKPDDVERILTRDNDRVPARMATYNAYLMVEHLIQNRGMPAVAAFVLALGEEPDPDAAARRVFGTSYDAVLEEACGWGEPPPPAMP